MIETIMDSSIDTPLLPTPTNVKGIRVKVCHVDMQFMDRWMDGWMHMSC